MTKKNETVEQPDQEVITVSADPEVVPADDERSASERQAGESPAPVPSPGQNVTPVDPSQPVGNWGVYPPAETETSPETGIADPRDTEE